MNFARLSGAGAATGSTLNHELPKATVGSGDVFKTEDGIDLLKAFNDSKWLPKEASATAATVHKNSIIVTALRLPSGHDSL